MVEAPQWGRRPVAVAIAVLAIGCDAREESGGDACAEVDGLLPTGRWYGRPAPISMDIRSDGAAEIYTCDGSAIVHHATADHGQVDWRFDWLDLSGAPTGAGSFTGVACAQMVSGTFDFGPMMEFSQENTNGCCACE